MAEQVRRRLDGVHVHPLLMDGTVAAALAVAAVGQLVYEHPAGEGLRLALAAMAPAPLLLRRRYPIGCTLLQIGCLVGLLMSPPLGDFFAVLLGFYSIGALSRWRVASLAYVVAGQVALLLAVPEARPPIPDRFQNLMLATGLWLVGNAVRSLRQGMEQVERERRLAAQMAAAEERSRIARELHDVVAHSVGVMVVQAGAARRTLDRQPEQAVAVLRSVEAVGREALAELRHMLGLLSGDQTDTGLRPLPSLRDLDALIERVRAAGLPVTSRVEDEPRALGPSVELTAYRIVQEALTNTLKHAPGARAEVVVSYRGHELAVEVADAGGRPAAGPPAGAGRGLIGMRERVAMLGGDLEAGKRGDGFRVSARLPLEPSQG